MQVTPRAQQRARTVQQWWRANQLSAVTTFADEYEAILGRLAAMSPRSPIGVRYRNVRGHDVWRVRLKASQQNVFYSFDEAADLVVVRMIWGAKRGPVPGF
ncbi:MAG TPA: hypothetical protein VFP84_21225 [Kofleriaceae bacterium]|nr:hypothetical protein [Kofleriaceae bacterium]